MTVTRHVAGEHPDLAVRDLTRRAGVLARNSARGLALLQKAGFVDDKNRVSIAQRFQCILTRHIAQCVGIPSSSAQDRLLAPRAWIADRFRPHPTRLARFVAQQPIECPADAATRPCVNSGRIRCLTSRSDDAHSVSAFSTDAPPIIRSPIMVTYGFRTRRNLQWGSDGGSAALLSIVAFAIGCALLALLILE